MSSYTTDAGINYEELEGSPTFTASPDGMTARRILSVAWADIDLFLLEMFPLPAQGESWYEYSREVSFPNKPWLYVTNVSVEPFDPKNPRVNATAGYNQYPAAGARITVEYATKSLEKSEDGVIQSHQLSVGGDAMLMPNRTYGWLADQVETFVPIQTEDVRVAKIIPTIEHTLTFEQVPNPPFSKIEALIGCVNSTAFPFDARIATLLFIGCDADRRITTQGTEAWKIVYRFSQRIIKGRTATGEMTGEENTAIGWNHFFRPDTGLWDVLLTEYSDYVYKEQDFTPLFQPEPEESSSHSSEG